MPGGFLLPTDYEQAGHCSFSCHSELPERIQLGPARNAPRLVSRSKTCTSMITALSKNVLPGIGTSSPWEKAHNLPAYAESHDLARG